MDSDESLITIHGLLKAYKININKEMEDKSVENRIEYVIKTVEQITGIANFGEWLGKVLEFDAFILNEDRHFNNIAVIRNSCTNRYRLSPVFDNGLSLLSDLRDYSMGYPLRKLADKVKSRPFSSRYSRQIKAVHSVIGTGLVIDNSLLNINTSHITIYPEEYVTRVKNVLRVQSNKYSYLIK